MSNETKTAAVQRPPRQKRKSPLSSIPSEGLRQRLQVGIENITPAMILGYVLVYILRSPA